MRAVRDNNFTGAYGSAYSKAASAIATATSYMNDHLIRRKTQLSLVPLRHSTAPPLLHYHFFPPPLILPPHILPPHPRPLPPFSPSTEDDTLTPGFCSDYEGAVYIKVFTVDDIARRLNYPRARTVILELNKNLVLDKGLLFDSRYSCTVLRSNNITGSGYRISYFGADQPVLRIWNTSNVLVLGVSFSLGVRTSSPECVGVPENGIGVNCPTIHVYRSYGIQIAKGTVFGRIDLFRCMSSRVDSMRVTGVPVFNKSPGVIRVAMSGYGPTLEKSYIAITNNEVYGESIFSRSGVRGCRDSWRTSGLARPLASFFPLFFFPLSCFPRSRSATPPHTPPHATTYTTSSSLPPFPLSFPPVPPPLPGVDTPIVLYQGAIGVIVRNNYVHDFIFAGIRCGADVHYAADCVLATISYNIVVAAGTNRSGDQDAAGIYFCTHWFSPANLAECNYVFNGDHCYYLDYVTSGVTVNGGACVGTYDGIKVNNGKW
ncbi:unnamed protein product [Closterium sp. Yama58-4]|nr:unnamed protein product [Closterium sp. Yama58-4]